MPDPILVSRLAALERDLRVLSDLEALKDRLGLAKVRVHKRIWNGYQYTIIREISALVEKRIPRVRNQMAKAEAGGKHAGDRARVAWKLYAAIYRKSRWISQECLEFIAGLAFRDKKLDEQICQIADALIESYAEASGKEPSLAVPSSQESLSRTLGRIVRLRFPEWTIWTLPLVAHEYGHVVIPDVLDHSRFCAGELPALMAQYPGGAPPGAAPATPEESRKRAESYLIEFMADAFATYIMGPAYPCAAILLRFDPRAGEGQENSPIDLDRARVVLRILGSMSQAAGAISGYAFAISYLSDRWDEAVRRANPTGAATTRGGGSRDIYLDGLADRILRHFHRNLPAANYPHGNPRDGWQVAQRWATIWGNELAKKARRLTAQLDATSDNLRDVMNAAWVCRLDHEGEISELEDVVHETWARIGERSEGTPGPVPQVPRQDRESR